MGIALSGGKDSTALLALAKEHQFKPLVALHVDHRARHPESCQKECEVVDQLCHQLKVPLIRKTLPSNLGRVSLEKSQVSSLGRNGKKKQSLDSVATAHHAQDQTETLLFNLLRGADLKGLTSMLSHWIREGQQFCRPL